MLYRGYLISMMNSNRAIEENKPKEPEDLDLYLEEYLLMDELLQEIGLDIEDDENAQEQ